ncbi:hypothetical protein [Ramlibacter tataouinensis]|uniref:Uncharacterized protein n=1 Tax=Ramlibacter tataouinensis (strain ATCC BAA-407 / DSM 14655 / LMG 21543 / TTB310) TaxID=365046 RepID=F5Y040_RAMTT|nr:hypothetical protein [Ramlibacter tataouinensis]AEG94589.1 hypothetical protein Rta_34760 [Ramlibacter tataouinensis TTB310]
MNKHRVGAGRAARSACVLAALLGLGACSSVGFGIGIPVGPVSLGVGVGSGGVSAGVGTGVGPVGVGVGVNQRGQVIGGAGVGASVPVGGGPVRAGVGVGTGTVLYDPNRPSTAPVVPQAGARPPASAADQIAP